MGITGAAKIGAVRAESLVQEHGNIWNILSAGFAGPPNIKDWHTLAEVKGIGEKTIQTMLRSVGRGDV